MDKPEFKFLGSYSLPNTSAVKELTGMPRVYEQIITDKVVFHKLVDGRECIGVVVKRQEFLFEVVDPS